MDLKKEEYARFALTREMMETVEVVRRFDCDVTAPFIQGIKEAGRLMISGEGSSRIFPAKHAISLMRSWGSDFPVITDGGRQAMEYDLDGWAVFCASNSGRTKEMVSLLEFLKSGGVQQRFGLTAREDTPMESLCERTHVLSCGWENAVAATKSVVEQALFYHSLAHGLVGRAVEPGTLDRAADGMESALEMEIPSLIVDKAASASRVYFAGRNNGVAEELTLKTNEITRLPSAYLEGTYAVHGIEEVMSNDELVVVVDPFDGELDKFREVLEDGVGMTLVAIATRELSVPTIVVPDCNGANPYVQLAAGWNLLVEMGMARGVDLDNPVRARKVGNEATIPQAC